MPPCGLDILILSGIRGIIKLQCNAINVKNKDSGEIMLLEEIRPFMRYARVLEFTKEQKLATSVPRDCRLFYTDSGVGRILTCGREYEMEQGSIMLIHVGIPYRLLPADVTYLAYNFDFTSAHKSINMPVPPVYAEQAEEELLIENVNIEDAPELNSCLFLMDGFPQKSILRKILIEYTQRLPLQEISTGTLLNTVLISVLRESRRQSVCRSRVDTEKIINYVQQHFTESLTNAEIAEIFHFHPNYISTVMKQSYGKTLHQYVLELRILEGISMLEENKYSIDEIARAVGFYDSSYFSRYFKKITGVSPRQYRHGVSG